MKFSVTIATGRVTSLSINTTPATGGSITAACRAPTTASRHPTYFCLACGTLYPVATPLFGDNCLTLRTLQCLTAFYQSIKQGFCIFVCLIAFGAIRCLFEFGLVVFTSLSFVYYLKQERQSFKKEINSTYKGT